MSGRVVRYHDFLRNVIHDKTILKTASFEEIQLMIEIIYNIFKNTCVFLTKKEQDILLKNMCKLYPLITERDPDLGKELLLKLNKETIKSVVHPVLVLIGRSHAL